MAESKVYPDAASALKGLTFDGMTVMSGGFGLCGNPENCIAALRADGVKGITVISNNCGADNYGLYVLLANGHSPAQDYPARPVRIIVPYAAGTGM